MNPENNETENFENEPEFVSDNEPERTVPEPVTKQSISIGGIVIVATGVVCLLVIVLVILARGGSSTPPPTAPSIDVSTSTEPVTEEESTPDPTVVEGRDSEILGLRIDPKIGRMFTLPDTGQVLYASVEPCIDECLDTWTPYEAAEAIAEGSVLGTVERTEGTLQYAWKGRALYTFNQDDERSVLGDGYSGTWRIARP